MNQKDLNILTWTKSLIINKITRSLIMMKYLCGHDPREKIEMLEKRRTYTKFNIWKTF